MQATNIFEPKVFISVVSHGHGVMISDLNCLKKLSENFYVVIKNNCSDEALLNYNYEHSMTIIDEDYYQGFGYNNNVVFNYCCEKLNMQENDLFIVLNPDLVVTPEAIVELKNNMIKDSTLVSTINLYKDENFQIHDESVRRFPSLKDFCSSFLLGRNETKINKSMIQVPTVVDWCAGSFMAFKTIAFKNVNGFDINYFMYCEDVDLCYRLIKNNCQVVFYPSILGVHKAQHKNRSIFSRHFLWHVKSALRFILARNNLVTNRSNIS